MRKNAAQFTFGFLLLAAMSLPLLAQQRAGGAGARPAPQPIPLFFKETWKDSTNVPVTQEFVANPDLQLKVYGKDANVTGEGNIPHIWTGLCTPNCAVALRHKDSFVDLTGKAKMRWIIKTSGFHQVRPVLKLADGTWLVGDFADASLFDFRQTEFFLADVRWMKIDMETRSTKGALLDKVDLSKVDEVGFVDLIAGSGHGLGGYSDVGWIEVYGKPVKREP